MNRRMLLRAALGLSAGALSAPIWSGVALASGSPAEQRAALSKAWQSAARAKKAVVVMLIPADDGAKWTRGNQLGQWLNNASDADLAPLSAAEVVFALASDVRKLVPDLQVSEDDWFVVVRLDPLTAEGVAVTLPKVDPDQDPNFGDPDYGTPKHEAWNKARIAAEGQAIQGALYPVLQRLGPAPTGDGAKVRAALVTKAPAGAHWASSWGCGTDIEGVESQYAIDCGMGHVPEGSRRFLYLHDVAGFQGI